MVIKWYEKAIAYTFAILAVCAVLFISGMVSGNEAPQLPPCQTEDSDNCYWDADTMGNGTGKSFTVINGIVTYK